MSSSPHVIENAVVGGVTGKLPLGAGLMIEQGATGQSLVVCWLVVGIVKRSVKRADVSTSCVPAGFEILVLSPNDPLRSKLFVMPWPKWS